MDFNRLAAWFWTVVLFGFALASNWLVLAWFEGAPAWRRTVRSANANLAPPDSRVRASNRLRIVVWLAYGLAIIWVAAAFEESAARTPLVFIAVGLPLVFRLVPRNWFYGMRTPRTMLTTDETWYRQNVITGVALVSVGTVWVAVLATRVLVFD